MRFETIRKKIRFNAKIEKIDGGSAEAAGGSGGLDIKMEELEEMIARTVNKEIDQIMVMLPGMMKMQGGGNSG